MNGKSGNLNSCASQLYPSGCLVPSSELLCILDADQANIAALIYYLQKGRMTLMIKYVSSSDWLAHLLYNCLLLLSLIYQILSIEARLSIDLIYSWLCYDQLSIEAHRKLV